MKEEIICDWKICEVRAVRHVRFGFTAQPGKPPYVATHGNFCPLHILKMNRIFSAVEEFEIGACPDGCG